jgi:hypothetical protein
MITGGLVLKRDCLFRGHELLHPGVKSGGQAVISGRGDKQPLQSFNILRGPVIANPDYSGKQSQ